MKILGSTKREIEEKVLIDSLTLAGVIVAAGVLMWLSIIFVSLGSKLVILGAIMGIAGWPLSKLIPSLIRYYEIVCPECLEVNKVSNSAAKFCCEQCGSSLFGRNYWKNKYNLKIMDRKKPKSYQTGTISEISELVDLKIKEMS